MSKPNSCSGCVLENNGFNFINNEGSGASGVLVVGDSPGEQENRDLLPFRPYAPAGSVLERTFTKAGQNRASQALTNIVRCRPSSTNFLEHAPYEIAAIQHCQTHLEATIREFKPKVLFGLGNIPLRSLTGFSGKKQSISHVRGFYLDGIGAAHGIPVISSIHPALIARGKSNMLGVLRADYLRALHLAQSGGKFTRPAKSYQAFPPIDVARRWLADARLQPEALITYDIETAESLQGIDESEIRSLEGGLIEVAPIKEEFQEMPEHLIPPEEEVTAKVEVTRTRITQIQFSIRPFEAIILPFDGDYIQIAREILALPNPKMGHNSFAFDEGLLANAGVPVLGRHDDSMLIWHHLQADLPKGLQFVTSFFLPEAEPWKHLNDSDPGRYGGDDVAYLRHFGPIMFDQLRERGLYNGYDRLVRQFWPTLKAASARGIPIDNPSRLALREKIEEERKVLGAELQLGVPSDLRGVEPKNGYTNPNLALKKIKEGGYGLKPGEQWAIRDFDGPGGTIPIGTPELASLVAGGAGDVAGGSKAKPVAASESATGIMLATLTGGGPGWRWARVQPFLPNSGQQILKWIKWRREEDIKERMQGYAALPRYNSQTPASLRAMAERTTAWKVPKVFREDKETTSKVELQRLCAKTGDNFLNRVIEHREMGKLISTYVDGWAPAGDGCVHGTFSFSPATMQLAAVRPNILNPMKHGRFAKPFRLVIKAKPEHCLIEIDMTAFHARTLGLEAQDADYMRLAAMDIHSFVAAHMLKFPSASSLMGLSDADLKKTLKGFRADPTPYTNGWTFDRIRNEKAKRCIAEGSLVLTQKGLVPIENITMEHRLWDGVEWVHHAGLIDQGIKEVITYDGLTATADHEVFLEDGTSALLGEAASRMARLQVTGHEGTPIRTSHRDLLERSARKRLYQVALSMQPVWYQKMDQQIQSDIRAISGMPIMQPDQIQASGGSGTAIRRNFGAMYTPPQSSIQALWGPGDRTSLQDTRRIREMGREQSASRELSGSGDRSAQEQRPLRTRESTFGYAPGAVAKSPKYRMGFVERAKSFTARLAQSLWPSTHVQTGSYAETNRRGDNSTRDSIEGRTESRISQGATQKVRVFDIADAGPRRAYTVENKLVANCILGLGFGLGAEKLYNMNMDSFANKAEAKKIQDLIKELFPRIFKFQSAIREKAHRQGYLDNRWGFRRYFWDVYHWDSRRGCLVPGNDAEACIAYLPASGAFGMLRSNILLMEELGLLERYGFCNSVHDSVLFHCKLSLAEECIEKVLAILQAPCAQLADSIVAPNGFSCGAEASIGFNWAEMKDPEKFFGGAAHAA